MKKVLFICFFIVFLNLNSLQINFVSGNPDISERSINEIKQFKIDFQEYLQYHPNAKIYITGYTDNSTSDEKKISLKRAKKIKDYLVNNFNYQAQLIEIIGMGVANPIASNDNQQESKKNNRVEIYFDQPEATIKWFSNDVTYISTRSGKQQFANKNAELFQKDIISTNKKSRVGIEISENNLLVLEENSSMIIYGDILAEKTKLLDNKFHVELKSGRLCSRLNSIADKSFNVKTPSAMLELYSKKSEISYLQNMTLLSVYEGYGIVSFYGRTLKVDEGFCLKIEQGRVPAQPRKLPSKPRNFHISKRGKVFGGESVTFGWYSENSRNVLQISENENFDGFIEEYEIFGSEYSVNMDFGNYFARVKTIDDDGFSSFFSKVIPFSVKTVNVLGFANVNHHKITRITSREFILKGRVIGNNQVKIGGEIIPKDEDGYFSYKMKLQDGYNKIMVTAIGSNGQRREYSIEIFYIRPIYEDPIFPEIAEKIIYPSSRYDYNIIVTLSPGCTIQFENEVFEPDELGEVDLWTTLRNGDHKLDFLVTYPDGYQKTYSYSIKYVNDISKKIDRSVATILGILILISPLMLY